MEETIFSGNAAVEIQGPRVLEFVSINENQAEFDVIGLSEPKIRLIDSRPTVCQTMQNILDQRAKVETLADEFNKPARVTILPVENGQMTVRLEKTRAWKPRFMLWVAIGIGEEIPYYNFKRLIIQPLVDQTIALFSLYKRPQTKQNKPASSISN
jgi:hypothetical protein